MSYPTEPLFKEIENDYGSPIIFNIANSEIINSTKYFSITDFILIGPLYIEFTKSMLGKSDINNFYTFEINYNTDNYYPNPVTTDSIGWFNTNDIDFSPGGYGYELERMDKGNYLPFDLETIFFNQLTARNPIKINYQLLLDININGTPEYDGDVNIYIYQFIKDIRALP
jgi:hypothetical protein